MSLYKARFTVEIDGKIFDEHVGFTDESVTKYGRVELMNKTGHFRQTERYGFSLEVREPLDGYSVDILNLTNSTVTVQDVDGGERITYFGVYTLETGEGTASAGEAFSRTVTFSAENKKIER